MFITIKPFVTASLFVSLSSLAGAAVAGDARGSGTEERSIEVNYADLNLEHPVGQRKLEARISRAAKQVCGLRQGKVSLRESIDTQACTIRAKSAAMLAFNRRGQVQVAARADTASNR